MESYVRVPFVCFAAGALFGLSLQAQSRFPHRKPVPPKSQYHQHRPHAPGYWQPLVNQPGFLTCGAVSPLLLTDGTVMVQDGGCQDWWRLTPDASGSYVNGTWSAMASLPAGYSPLYHSSAVLPDGRVIIEGGEYNFYSPVWTNQGAIYDPLTDTWTAVAPPSGWDSIGDASSVILANGTYMQANCCTADAALLNPQTLTWTPTGSGKFDSNNEEGWTLLPNTKVLTVDAYVPIGIPFLPDGTNSEIYDAVSGEWQSAGSTLVQLWDSAAACLDVASPSFEVGPAVLRPDGTVFYTGANSCGASHTAIYNSYSGTWKAGPDFPGTLGIPDGPAALEPNGKVLMMASSPNAVGAVFLEWDGKNLTEIQGTPNAPSDDSYYGNMLILPTGQILLTDFSDDIEIFTPGKGGDDRWKPKISWGPFFVRPGRSYQISGKRFNGVSQGAAYGDDAQAATNFPLVRLTNFRTGHVFYSRTHDHTSMAVASDAPVTTTFDVPLNQELGLNKLEVVANGIASHPVVVVVF